MKRRQWAALASAFVRAAPPLVLISFVPPAAAETLWDWKCTGEAGVPWDEQIAGCTNALKSGRFVGAAAAAGLSNRGNAYQAKGDLDGALADYSQAIQVDPTYVNARFNRGNAYKAKGDLARAIADYNEAVQLDPKYVFAYNNRGNAYYARSDLDRAIADYDQAIQLDPKNAATYNNRGNVYYARSDFDRALADYNQAIRLDPKYATAYDN